jgi:hypothetical protein
MKRLAVALAFATLFAACSKNGNTNNEAANSARDSVKMLQYSMKAMRDSLRIDSLQRITAEQAMIATQQAQLAQQAALQAQKSQRVAYTAPRRTYVKGVSENYYSTTPAKKKGWSSAAKGAAIGAGAGAITGVLVDKKDGRGAIVGGLLGAGTGYVIGRQHDKKTGRAQ